MMFKGSADIEGLPGDGIWTEGTTEKSSKVLRVEYRWIDDLKNSPGGVSSKSA
jgi:hypothetical protein